MRKIKLTVLTVLTVSVLALTACGDKEDAKDNASQTTPTEAAVTTTTPAADDNASDGAAQFSSMKEYVESKDVQDMVTTLNESLKDAGMVLTITGEDNKMIYTYKLNVESNDDTKKTLQDGLTEQADTFKTAAASLKNYVQLDNPVVVVTYQDKDGKEIISQEFPAE